MGPIIILLAIGGFSWLIFHIIRIGRREGNLPPGPPTIPVLGNIHLLPLRFIFLRFTEWSKDYGEIFSLKIGSGTIVVLSDMETVKEFLDDRSSETSSRPSYYAADIVTGKNYMATAPSDSMVWQMGRKAILPLMSYQAVQAHLPIADAETVQLLHDLLHNPDELCSHISRCVLSFITSVVFGKPLPRHDSPEAALFRDYIRHWTTMLSLESAPVDLVPLLKYIPERWAPWRQLWRKTRRLQQSVYFSFLEHAEKTIESGVKSGTYIESILNRREELGLTRDMVAYAGGVLMDGGAETAASFLQSMILCLVQSPAALKKAQDEIDIVIGGERLPASNDIIALPYVQAVIKETHRFRPVLPSGVPHATVTDCQYRGYTIPKGGIFHDPEKFERPEDFWPERYLLTPDGTKQGLPQTHTIRASLQFGSGKRLCPGMHLANTNSALAVMRLLWAFDFAPIDDSVSPSQIATWNIENEYNDGITFNPKPFQCKITPRSKEKVKIIENCYQQRGNQTE